MNKLDIKKTFSILIIASLIAESTIQASEISTPKNFSSSEWALSLYGGPGTNDIMQNIVRANIPQISPSSFIALALDKKLFHLSQNGQFELETQIGKHFENSLAYELNGLIVFRWTLLPWSKFIRSSFGFGNGLSYATAFNSIEATAGPDLSKLLYSILLEFDFSLSDTDTWSIVTRVHHRSGIFGLITRANQGSNYLCLGVKVRF